MKKLIFAFALMVGVMSCTGNSTNTETVETTDSTEVVVDSTAVDPVNVNTVDTVLSL